MRARFETWLRTFDPIDPWIENCFDVDTDTGLYRDPFVQRSWAAWQAARCATRPGSSVEALRLAREIVSDPDTRAKIKVALEAEGKPGMAALVDEAVIVATELIRMNDEERAPQQQEGK